MNKRNIEMIVQSIREAYYAETDESLARCLSYAGLVHPMALTDNDLESVVGVGLSDDPEVRERLIKWARVGARHE